MSMILVDSSIWIAYLRYGEQRLVELLGARLVLCHPFVIGEVACGYLPDRGPVLAGLQQLPSAPMARHHEVMWFLEHHSLTGQGIGWIDAHLLVSAALSPGVEVWTQDRRLARAAAELGLGYQPAP